MRIKEILFVERNFDESYDVAFGSCLLVQPDYNYSLSTLSLADSFDCNPQWW